MYESFGGKVYGKETEVAVAADGEMTQYPFACVNIERLN